MMSCGSFLTYLECNVLGSVRHDEAEVRAVLMEVVELSHLRGQLSGSDHGLDFVALTPIFHVDIKIVLVTGASDCGLH